MSRAQKSKPSPQAEAIEKLLYMVAPEYQGGDQLKIAENGLKRRLLRGEIKRIIESAWRPK